MRIDGGVAGNVIPDAASVTVNFRFAPDRSVDAALQHVHDVFDGLDVQIELTDSARGCAARPVAAGRQGSGRGRRRAGPGEIRLDGRVPVRRPGHTGGQLRARRPQPGAPPRRAGAGRPITAAVEMLRGYLAG